MKESKEKTRVASQESLIEFDLCVLVFGCDD